MMRETNLLSVLSIEFSRVLDDQSPLTQRSLKVNFVSCFEAPRFRLHQDAQSPTNTASILPRDSSHSLRRDGAAAAFLQQAGASSFAATIPSIAPAQRGLPSLGSHFGPPLCDHGGPATHPQNRHLAYNGPSFPARPSTLSRSVHLAPLPEANASQVIRQLVALHDHLRAKLFPLPKPRTTLTFDLDSVVLTVYGKRSMPAWVTTLTTGATFLPPADLLRGAFAGVLARLAATGQYGDQHGPRPLPQGLPGQGAPAPRLLSSPLPGGLGCFGRRVVEFLDTAGCGYTIVAKQYSTIKARALECRFHKPLTDGRSESFAIDLCIGNALIASSWCDGPFLKTRWKHGN